MKSRLREHTNLLPSTHKKRHTHIHSHETELGKTVIYHLSVCLPQVRRINNHAAALRQTIRPCHVSVLSTPTTQSTTGHAEGGCLSMIS